MELKRALDPDGKAFEHIKNATHEAFCVIVDYWEKHRDEMDIGVKNFSLNTAVRIISCMINATIQTDNVDTTEQVIAAIQIEMKGRQEGTKH